MYILASEPKGIISKQSSRQQVSLTENLKAVADAYYQSSALGKFLYCVHNRTETSDRSNAQIVAIRETTRQNYTVIVAHITFLMPNIFNGLF
jgi:hypothetical protein